jgi:hypothetical protein
MTRRFPIPAIALFLSFIMAAIGSVPRDAMAGIVILSQSRGASTGQEEGPAKIRSAADFAPRPQRDGSARYRVPGIMLLLILLLVLWLIYRTFTGWKPMISGQVGDPGYFAFFSSSISGAAPLLLTDLLTMMSTGLASLP